MRNVSQRQMDFAIAKVKTKGIFTGVGNFSKSINGICGVRAIGTIIGVLPGAGRDIAAWIAYAPPRELPRRRSSTEKFYRGDRGFGTANNACLAGDWSRARLRDSGDSITAVVSG